MRMLQKQLLIFFIIYVSESSCVMDALYDAGEKVWEFYSTINSSKVDPLADPRTVEEHFGHDNSTNEIIRDQMYEIHVKLREIEESTDSKMMKNLMEIVKSRVIIVRCIEIMKIFIDSINDDYTKFYQIIIEDGFIHNRPLNDLKSIFFNIESNIGIIRKIMSHPNELLPNEQSLITAINGYAKTQYEEICNSYQSIDGILVYLFKIAIIAEIKTSLMLIFANLYQYRKNQEWKIMSILAKTQFQTSFESYVNIMQLNLDLTTGLYIRACDPENGGWILNENHYELNGITQEIIFRYRPTVCAYQSCKNIWNRRATRCDARYYDKRSGCSGVLAGCENLGAVQACVLKDGPHKFQYVNSTIFGFFGNNSRCSEDDGYIIDNEKGVDSVYATCSCQCNGNHNKISLVIMESPRDSNKVITGLRFKRENNILYIQPRVGRLMANGYIQKYSDEWLQIPKDIDAFQIHPVDEENSLFFLDDILLPQNFVFTGVRFKKVTRGAVTGFAIEIFGVLFDYRTGKLNFGSRIQLSTSKSNPGRPLLFDPISSIRAKKHNILSSPDHKYVQLKQSLLRSDFGQSMLPLFDAVPITTDPPSALGGMGIFHKGVEGYAGFFSLRAYGIRYTHYFENFTSVHTIKGRVNLFT